MPHQRKKTGSTPLRYWDYQDISKLDLNFANQSKRPISKEVRHDAEALLALAKTFAVEDKRGLRLRPTLELRNEIVAAVNAFLRRERILNF